MNHYTTNVSPADVADPNDLLVGCVGELAPPFCQLPDSHKRLLCFSCGAVKQTRQ